MRTVLTLKLFKLSFASLFIILFVSCVSNNELTIDYKHPSIKYSGRIDTTSVIGADLYWSGTSIQINFEGEELYGLFEDNKGDNYYNIIIDQDSLFILRPNIKQYYNLAAGLEKGEHTVEIFKRTPWNRGKTTFFGFKIKGASGTLKKTPVKKRKMEFYGNSITEGYAIEDFSGKDSPDSTYTNNYRSFSAITARYFNADYQCICKGGIGITISWFPLTMPEMYDRLIPEDPTSKWDFSLYTPDVVVINLFQNDSWLTKLPKHPEFKARFENTAPDDNYLTASYKNFVKEIRNKYPKANIVCILGNMDATKEGSQWPAYINNAVNSLNDAKIFTHFIPYKNTFGHPSIEEQEELAESLVQFIETHIDW